MSIELPPAPQGSSYAVKQGGGFKAWFGDVWGVLQQIANRLNGTKDDTDAIPAMRTALTAATAALDAIAAADAAAWSTYTPVLTSNSTAPGAQYTASGRWTRRGRWVRVHFQIIFNAGFTPGTGAYFLSIPTPGSVAFAVTCGHARITDSSTGKAHVGARVALNSTTTVGFQYALSAAAVGSGDGGTLTNVGAGAPFVWATGDGIDGYFDYEAAS